MIDPKSIPISDSLSEYHSHLRKMRKAGFTYKKDIHDDSEDKVAAEDIHLTYFDNKPLIFVFLIIITTNLIGFMVDHRYNSRSEVFCNGICFGLSFTLSSIPTLIGEKGTHIRRRLSAAFVTIWSIKLQVMLFFFQDNFRTESTRKNSNGTTLSSNGGESATNDTNIIDYFLLTILGCLCLITHCLGLTSSDPGNRWVVFVGASICILGIAILTIADYQKWVFIENDRYLSDPGLDTSLEGGRYCDIGLWSISQNANLFGDLLFWIGLYVLNASSMLETWYDDDGNSFSSGIWSSRRLLIATLFGPIMMTLFIHGQAVQNNELAIMKHRNNNAYSTYQESTPLLVPRLSQRLLDFALLVEMPDRLVAAEKQRSTPKKDVSYKDSFQVDNTPQFTPESIQNEPGFDIITDVPELQHHGDDSTSEPMVPDDLNDGQVNFEDKAEEDEPATQPVISLNFTRMQILEVNEINADALDEVKGVDSSKSEPIISNESNNESLNKEEESSGSPVLYFPIEAEKASHIEDDAVDRPEIQSETVRLKSAGEMFVSEPISNEWYDDIANEEEEKSSGDAIEDHPIEFENETHNESASSTDEGVVRPEILSESGKLESEVEMFASEFEVQTSNESKDEDFIAAEVEVENQSHNEPPSTTDDDTAVQLAVVSETIKLDPEVEMLDSEAKAPTTRESLVTDDQNDKQKNVGDDQATEDHLVPKPSISSESLPSEPVAHAPEIPHSFDDSSRESPVPDDVFDNANVEEFGMTERPKKDISTIHADASVTVSGIEQTNRDNNDVDAPEIALVVDLSQQNDSNDGNLNMERESIWSGSGRFQVGDRSNNPFPRTTEDDAILQSDILSESIDSQEVPQSDAQLVSNAFLREEKSGEVERDIKHAILLTKEDDHSSFQPPVTIRSYDETSNKQSELGDAIIDQNKARLKVESEKKIQELRLSIPVSSLSMDSVLLDGRTALISESDYDDTYSARGNIFSNLKLIFGNMKLSSIKKAADEFKQVMMEPDEDYPELQKPLPLIIQKHVFADQSAWMVDIEKRVFESRETKS